MITDINQLDLNKTYTYSDYLTWQFDEMVELIKGKVFRMSPTPGSKHQRVSRNIGFQIEKFLFKNRCEVFRAPFDIRFTDGITVTIVQPDICVICDPSKIDEKGCNGAPDFIIEILSPGSSHRDAHIKFKLYEENGVNEYWIVSPNDQTVDIFLLENQVYQFKGKYVHDDIAPVVTLPGLEIDLKDVFENV